MECSSPCWQWLSLWKHNPCVGQNLTSSWPRLLEDCAAACGKTKLNFMQSMAPICMTFLLILQFKLIVPIHGSLYLIGPTFWLSIPSIPWFAEQHSGSELIHCCCSHGSAQRRAAEDRHSGEIGRSSSSARACSWGPALTHCTQHSFLNLWQVDAGQALLHLIQHWNHARYVPT